MAATSETIHGGLGNRQLCNGLKPQCYCGHDSSITVPGCLLLKSRCHFFNPNNPTTISAADICWDLNPSSIEPQPSGQEASGDRQPNEHCPISPNAWPSA